MGRYILSEGHPSNLRKFPFQVITSSKAIAFSINVPYYSLESLAQSIVRRQGKGIASTLLSRRLLQIAVGEEIDTKDLEGTAKAFLATVKDLLRSGIDLSKLQQNPDPRMQQLGNLVLAYQKQLRQKNRLDSAELYWHSAIEIKYQKTYLFYGYYAPGKDELALIDAIAGENSILVLPTYELLPQNQVAKRWLQDRGWEIQPSQQNSPVGINRHLQHCFSQKSILPERVSLNVFPNLEAEVRGVLSQVKVLLTQDVSVKDIVLVTNDEQLYGKTLMDVAWEYDLPIEVGYEIPLEQTRIGAWLKLMLEVIRDNFPFEATAKLLSHPLAKYMTAEIWTEARQAHPQGLIAWQRLGADLSLLNFRQGSYSRDVWVKRLLNIFSGWDVLEKAKAWAREIVAYYRIQEALKELSQPETQQLSKRAFIKEINEILALLTIPSQPGMGGIQLHCPTSLLGTNYPYVFVLGSAEGILPKATAENSILDFYNRKQLAKQGLSIETAIDIAQRKTFYFYCLLGVPTQSIVFSYPESIDRNATMPSPYLSRLGLKPSAANTLPLVSIESARRLYMRQTNLLPSDSSLLNPQITQAWQVEAHRESAYPPDLYDGVIGIGIDPQSKIFSASQLTQLGQCPFKWFSARLLKLKELVEAESELGAAVRGNLYHRCLELSLSQIKTAKDLAEFNREKLTQAFAIAEAELDLTQLQGWDVQRQEHLNLLALNLSTTEFLPPERAIIAMETKFNNQWYGLQLQGQVDRIDRTSTGLMVIDYKTSSVTPAGVKDAQGKASIDIQLAVYQDAIAQAHPNEVVESAAYYSLTKQKNISRPQKNPEQLAAFVTRVKSHLEKGHYPVAPDVDCKACRYCNYDLVCRRGDRLSRKPNYPN
jgi:ATP-dependent helicase/DNAse subunit B